MLVTVYWGKATGIPCAVAAQARRKVPVIRQMARMMVIAPILMDGPHSLTRCSSL